MTRYAQVECQDLQVAVLAEHEKVIKVLAAHIRQVNLGTVMTALGGERDPYDLHQWHLGGEVISITGLKFRNHTRKQDGEGAIELVIHALPGYGFNEAVSYLSNQVGIDAAVAAAGRYALTIAKRECLPRTDSEHAAGCN